MTTVVRSSKTNYKTRTYPTRVATGLRDITYDSNGNVVQNNATADITFSSGNEVIAYGTKPKKLRHLANYCSHSKHSKVLAGGVRKHSGVNTISNPDGTYEFQSVDGHAVISSATSWTTFIGQLDAVYAAKLGKDAQGFINDAFVSCKPDITQFSAPNFLLELYQLPMLFQAWKTKLSAFQKLADARLRWSYGVKPLQADLDAMYDIIASVYARCVEWNAKAGELLHVRKLMLKVDESKSGSFVYPSGIHSSSWNGYRYGKLTAFFTFQTSKIPALETMEGVLRVYLDAIGFELNPRIIWDAIPFTFVLDWLFDVGGWLQRFKMDTLELPVSLIDSYLQYKEELRCETVWQRGNDGAYIPQPRSGPVFEVHQFFGRLPIFPDFSAATAQGWKMPGINQLTNALSLATTLGRK